MVEATCPTKGGAMAFDPSDYDEVYETTSASEEGGVIDVELILGEADTPKRSECLGRA
jgi:hypothetical protein